MTTITINIPEQQVAALTAKAAAQGVSLEDWFRKVTEKEAPVTSVAHLQKTNPEEWRWHFKEFLAGRDRNAPVLSGEAMSRERIYSDRR